MEKKDIGLRAAFQVNSVPDKARVRGARMERLRQELQEKVRRYREITENLKKMMGLLEERRQLFKEIKEPQEKRIQEANEQCDAKIKALEEDFRKDKEAIELEYKRLRRLRNNPYLKAGGAVPPDLLAKEQELNDRLKEFRRILNGDIEVERNQLENEVRLSRQILEENKEFEGLRRVVTKMEQERERFEAEAKGLASDIQRRRKELKSGPLARKIGLFSAYKRILNALRRRKVASERRVFLPRRGLVQGTRVVKATTLEEHTRIIGGVWVEGDQMVALEGKGSVLTGQVKVIDFESKASSLAIPSRVVLQKAPLAAVVDLKNRHARRSGLAVFPLSRPEGAFEEEFYMGGEEGAVIMLGGRIGGATHRATKKVNQDGMGIRVGHSPQGTRITLVVADGMGGHGGGEVASAVALRTVRQVLPTETNLQRVFSLADEAVLAESLKVDEHIRNMGSCIVMADILLRTDKDCTEVMVGNYGDCVAYMVDPARRLILLTRPQNAAADGFDHQNKNSPWPNENPARFYEFSRNYRFKFMVTGALGIIDVKSKRVEEGKPQAQPAFVHVPDLGRGSRLILCCDGPSDELNFREFHRIATAEATAAQVAFELVRRSCEAMSEKQAKAMKEGGATGKVGDNTTVVVFDNL